MARGKSRASVCSVASSVRGRTWGCWLTSPLLSMANSTTIDEAVRVIVTPSQASYFAGELFSVTVTITNIRRPETPSPARPTSQSVTHGHKRGAHSVSYVPMARPPTSPGMRTALPMVSSQPASSTGLVARQGVIGKLKPATSADRLSRLDNTSRRGAPTKSLSVSLSPQDFQPNGLDDWKGKSPARSLRTLETLVSRESILL